MVDFDKASVEIACPNCGFYLDVTVREIRLQDVLICRGCKTNIRLQDHMGTMAVAHRELQSSLDSLAATLSRLGF